MIFSQPLSRLMGLSTVLLLPFISGCDFLLFMPKGQIAAEQKSLIILSFLIMMIVVIPVLAMTIIFARKYNSRNQNNDYRPDWGHSYTVEFITWTVPLLIIAVLGVITYKTSYSLDPRQAITSQAQPEKETLRIHVIALDWKWLFIYPEQEIASVNELAIPVDTPVEFLITSDTVMNSFFIPQLGSMIYAMAGMENQLHLIADTPGTYKGFAAHYSGFGFSGMDFSVKASTEADFTQWINKVKAAPEALSQQRYQTLKAKTKDHPVEYFSKINPLFFNRTIESYTGTQNGQ